MINLPIPPTGAQRVDAGILPGFASAARQALRATRMPLHELRRRVDVDPMKLDFVLAAQVVPTVAEVQSICVVLGLDPAEFTGPAAGSLRPP